MQNLSIENPPPALGGESKSARKKKAKAEAAAAGTTTTTNGTAPSTNPSIVPAVPHPTANEDSSLDAKDAGDPSAPSEHPYVRELSKHIRNLHKKLAGMRKIDAILAENPGVELDALVAARKINQDQKSSVLKKPALEQQLAGLEEQVTQYRKFDAEAQATLQRQREEMGTRQEREVERVREEVRLAGVEASEKELRRKLLLFSQFLRAAAAKRTVEEETESDESRAFEGALLLVYSGDENAVEAAMKLIDGSEERVPSIEGVALPVTYSQIKQASLDHAPFQMEESWVDSVAEANATSSDREIYPPPTGAGTSSDPTLAYAGLTELDTAKTAPATEEDPLTSVTSPPQASASDAAGNAAGVNWDPAAPGGSAGREIDEGYEIIPRPADEVDTPVATSASGVTAPAPMAMSLERSASWADDVHAAATTTAASSAGAVAGNLAAEGWDRNGSSAAAAAAPPSYASATDVHLAEAAAMGGASGYAGVDGAAPAPAAPEDLAAAVAAGAPLEDADGFQSVPGRHHGRGRGGARGGFYGGSEFRGRGGRGRGGFVRGEGEGRGRGGRGGFRGRGEGGEFRGRGAGGRGRGFRGNGEGFAALPRGGPPQGAE